MYIILMYMILMLDYLNMNIHDGANRIHNDILRYYVYVITTRVGHEVTCESLLVKTYCYNQIVLNNKMHSL